MLGEKGVNMKPSKLNLLTMSVFTRMALALTLIAVLWLAIAWALEAAA
jgi:hypothetical protein